MGLTTDVQVRIENKDKKVNDDSSGEVAALSSPVEDMNSNGLVGEDLVDTQTSAEKKVEQYSSNIRAPELSRLASRLADRSATHRNLLAAKSPRRTPRASPRPPISEGKGHESTEKQIPVVKGVRQGRVVVGTRAPSGGVCDDDESDEDGVDWESELASVRSLLNKRQEELEA